MRRLTPALIALVFFIVLDSLVFYAAYVKHKADFTPQALSAPAPEFAWKAFDGTTHKLSELSGHVVVLHFWAAWCPPCREEFPKLLKAASEDKDVIFLTISSDDSLEKAQKFVKAVPALSGLEVPANVLYAWDPDRAITYDQYLTARYPESIILDSKLRMRRKYPTQVDWQSPDIRTYLKELKEGK